MDGQLLKRIKQRCQFLDTRTNYIWGWYLDGRRWGPSVISQLRVEALALAEDVGQLIEDLAILDQQAAEARLRDDMAIEKMAEAAQKHDNYLIRYKVYDEKRRKPRKARQKAGQKV